MSVQTNVIVHKTPLGWAQDPSCPALATQPNPLPRQAGRQECGGEVAAALPPPGGKKVPDISSVPSIKCRQASPLTSLPLPGVHAKWI